MNVAARSAVDADGVAIATIAQEIRSELEPLRGGAVLLAQHPEQAAVPSGYETEATFVGTIDDVIVGYSMVGIELLHDGSRLGVIRELGVLLGARGVGVGEAILGEVTAFCRSEHCRGIDSYALPGTRETKNFFETFGFTARLLVVHSTLTPAGTAGPKQAV